MEQTSAALTPHSWIRRHRRIITMSTTAPQPKPPTQPTPSSSTRSSPTASPTVASPSPATASPGWKATSKEVVPGSRPPTASSSSKSRLPARGPHRGQRQSDPLWPHRRDHGRRRLLAEGRCGLRPAHAPLDPEVENLPRGLFFSENSNTTATQQSWVRGAFWRSRSTALSHP